MESIKGNAVQAISGYATLLSPNKDETAVCGSHALLGLLIGWRLVTTATKMDMSLTNHKSLVACGCNSCHGDFKPTIATG